MVGARDEGVSSRRCGQSHHKEHKLAQVGPVTSYISTCVDVAGTANGQAAMSRRKPRLLPALLAAAHTARQLV